MHHNLKCLLLKSVAAQLQTKLSSNTIGNLGPHSVTEKEGNRLFKLENLHEIFASRSHSSLKRFEQSNTGSRFETIVAKADLPECGTLSVQVSTSQISVTGLHDGFVLQRITDENGNIIRASDNSNNNTSLMSFGSGTQYVIYYGNDTVSCCRTVFTKPLPVRFPQYPAIIETYHSSLVRWSKPDEYKTSYSYRVQTNVSSSATMLYNTIVTSESVEIMDLTQGETYTFLVYTIAADNITESDPMSYTYCHPPYWIFPSVNNYGAVDSFEVSWTKPEGKVDNYSVIISGAVNQTIYTNATQVTITGLLPGREYTVYGRTNSGTCYRAYGVTGVTYPTDAGRITITTIGTNNMTLSWMEPVDMAGVDKSYNISYGNSSGTWTVTSNTTSISLQNLTSGTNYTITVVTVGVRGYQSSAVTTSVYTSRYCYD
ncbi:receptor-type tyrosine-protein phosphatase eta-like [Engystomops pustulosus]|uniref:receptor-type tyrosine-protein phosphatase eta-like n=1 Tax=Engystomops pustulosus TaxID=76066 RepID=UPI003AFAC496